MIEYSGELLKSICTNYISVSYNGSYIVEPRFGLISFKIIKNNIYVDLILKRISGNGKVIINGINYIVTSKQKEIKNISITEDYLTLSRPKDSTGEIAILGINLQEEEIQEDMSINWKNLVKSFSNYKGLSLVKEELIASENAFIEPANEVTNLLTEPNGVYSIIGNKIIFNCKCRIISMDLNKEQKENLSSNYFNNRQSPYPVLDSSEESSKDDKSNNFKETLNTVLNSSSRESHNINIIYDTDQVKGLSQFNHKKNEYIKFINNNNKHYVVLKPSGAVSFPITGIEPDKDYIVIVSGKKINGNGRIRASLSSSLNEGNSSSAILNNIAGNIGISINSKKIENNLKLNLGMLSDSSGEVLISRVFLIEDLNDLKKFSYNEILSNNFKINYSYKESTIKNISVRDLTRDSAIFNFKNIDNYFNIKCSLNPLFYEARQYVLSLARYIKDISIVQNIDLIKQSPSSIEETLTIGKLGRLQPSRRLYIEEWGNKILPSKEDLNVIKLSDNILTPSNYNYVYLKYFFPEKILY